MAARMFDDYLGHVVDLRRIGQRLVACVQTLEETDLADDASVACWLRELEHVAAAGGEATRVASELRAAIADAWPRRLAKADDATRSVRGLAG